MRSAPGAAGEKLHKALARAGLGSRREIEGWIRAGRVVIDHRPARVGDRLPTGKEIVLVDGVRVRLPGGETKRTRVLIYHKPPGEICSRRDPGGRRSVFDELPAGRWISVGRLDLNTSGLLLFTNDGELAHRLMHPASEVEREYACRVLGDVSEADLTRLRRGIRLDGQLARFDKIGRARGSGVNRWYDVVLREGRYREVRRLWEATGHSVSRLVRVRYGDISLPRDLRPGQWRELPRSRVENLKRPGKDQLPRTCLSQS